VLEGEKRGLESEFNYMKLKQKGNPYESAVRKASSKKRSGFHISCRDHMKKKRCFDLEGERFEMDQRKVRGWDSSPKEGGDARGP